MFKINTKPNQFKTLRTSDSDFMMNDGIKLVPRAAIEISQQCPGEHKWIIQQCFENGWIKPVAYMRDSEYTWDLLQK